MGILTFGAAGAPATRDDETACVFVSSHGLLKSCEVRREPPDAAAKRWPRRLLSRHKAGGRIYVHAEAVADFAKRALPRIKAPFVLVSGDTTVPVGPEWVPQKVLDAVLGHPQLIRWHVQNAAVAHQKLEPMPLGLDYHTLAAGRKKGWGPQASPRAQEDLLRMARRAAPPPNERDPRAFCNWHFVEAVGGRAAVRAALPPDAVSYQPERLPRLASWELNAQHAFTVSPPGRGMDSHRIWEALALGSIPIVADQPINVLFADLPIVAVHDWANVTPERLERAREDVLARDFDFASLLLPAWRAKMAGRAIPELRMRFAEFLATDPDDLRTDFAARLG